VSDRDEIIEQKPSEEPCPRCGALMDLSGFLPYEEIICPSCGHEYRMRDQFDHYRIENLRGVGGMSHVFTARDMHLHRVVALKVLNRENSSKQERITQFEREARLTASINHPNVVRVYGVGRVEGNFYIAMEMVDGASLEEMLKSEQKLDEARVLELAIQTVEGLAAAHRIGLIHRDVKPGNILLTTDGKAKLVDFGLALVFETDTDESSEIWATPFYVPPEKLDGGTEDFRSDIYSLGATLFHLLAGRPPHDTASSSIDELKEAKAVPVKLGAFAPMVSSATQDVIHKMMEHNPEHRHSSYEELLAELTSARDEFLRSLDSLRGVTRQARREAEKRRSLSRLAAAAAAVVILLAVLVFVQLMSDERPAGEGSGTVETDNEEEWQAGSLAAGNISERFLSARNEMIAGNYGKARDEFAKLARDENVRQPTLNWSAMHAALAALLEGEPGKARELVGQARRSPRFREGRIGDLGEFFAKLADSFLQPWPLEDTVVGKMQEEFPEQWQFGAVLLAMKNWEHGRFASAASILQTIKESPKTTEFVWLADMNPVWTGMILDAGNLASLPDSASLRSLSDYETALAELEMVAGQLRHGGRGRDFVEARKARWSAGRDRLAEDESRKQVLEKEERRENERQDLVMLLERLGALREGYRYEEGVIEIESAQFSFEDLENQRVTLQWYWQGAVDFLQNLIADVNANGYRGPFQAAAGITNPSANITRATRTALVVEGRSGAISTELAKVPARELARIADHMLAKVPDERTRRTRRENLLLFASHNQLNDIVAAQWTGLSGEEGSDVFSIRWRGLDRIIGAAPGAPGALPAPDGGAGDEATGDEGEGEAP